MHNSVLRASHFPNLWKFFSVKTIHKPSKLTHVLSSNKSASSFRYNPVKGQLPTIISHNQFRTKNHLLKFLNAANQYPAILSRGSSRLPFNTVSARYCFVLDKDMYKRLTIQCRSSPGKYP